MADNKRKFNFKLYKKRHVALQILYFGWQYDGLACQENSKNTIEYHLFEALIRTCMVESRDKSNYNRCGRTDKGVSSYGQVVSLDIRSNLINENDSPQNVGLFTPEDYEGPPPFNPKSNRSFTKELDYVNILNKVLPDHIRVIAWSPVERTFSARFDCQQRSYRYLFPLGDLCIDSMSTALEYMIGEHDFRNLCTFDLKHGVTNHRRTIYSAKIQRIKTHSHQTEMPPSEYDYYETIITGQAFLYHQIRCIMSILFLVGMKREAPTIFRYLLDVSDKCTSKPHYTMASPLPLTLFDCSYDMNAMPDGWLYDNGALKSVIKDLKKLWFQYTTKSQMIESVLKELSGSVLEEACSKECKSLDDVKTELSNWTNFGLDCDRLGPNKYTQLLERTRGDSLEDRLEILQTKKLKETHVGTSDNS